MSNKIKSFILSPMYWAKALRMVAKGNDLDALFLLNKMHNKYYNYEYYTLKGFLALVLKKYEYSLSLMDQSLFMVNTNTNLNHDEKKYLEKYIYSSMYMAYNMMNKLDEAKKIENNIQDLTFSIDNVRSKIIRLFPIGSGN